MVLDIVRNKGKQERRLLSVWAPDPNALGRECTLAQNGKKAPPTNKASSARLGTVLAKSRIRRTYLSSEGSQWREQEDCLQGATENYVSMTPPRGIGVVHKICCIVSYSQRKIKTNQTESSFCIRSYLATFSRQRISTYVRFTSRLAFIRHAVVAAYRRFKATSGLFWAPGGVNLYVNLRAPSPYLVWLHDFRSKTV
jgi:hypothetical protein